MQEARAYDATEFADYRRKKPTPYMEELHFSSNGPDTADPDSQLLPDADLQTARED